MTKALGAAGALILASLVGGTLIGSAVADDEPSETDAGGATGKYCDVFMDTLTAELGVTADELLAAGKTAAGAVLDAAVEAGDLTEERADAVRARIEAADGGNCGLFKAGWARGFGHGIGHGWARGLLGGDVLEAAADAFGIESSELIGELRDAGSLEALAEELGAPYDELTASIVAAVQADLDASDVDPEHADAVIERLTEWLDAGGELRRIGPPRWRDRGSEEPDA
ncbi:MAG: hypothetical protein ACRDGD_09595 [Candidatus Limnocylindria bacterium]